jgi:hypothetical protein
MIKQTHEQMNSYVNKLLTAGEYDDSPWTAEEREALAWAAGKHAGWEDMDEYDSHPEKA